MFKFKRNTFELAFGPPAGSLMITMNCTTKAIPDNPVRKVWISARKW
jgi:hypothetical protein